MTPTGRVLLAFGLLWLSDVASPRAQQPQGAAPAPPVRTITQVRGDLYKVQSGSGVAAVTVFLVSRKGSSPTRRETAPSGTPSSWAWK